MSHDDPLDPSQRLLRDWQETGNVDSLDSLLRMEIEAISRRLRHRGQQMLRPSVSASDLAQEAVLRMLKVEEMPHFDDPNQLRAYLWKAAWRLLLNRVQKSGRDAVRLSDASREDALRATGGLGEVEERERTLALEFSMNLLRPDDREILELVYFQHIPIEEAAEKLGVARSAADMRLSRARKRLASKLADWAEIIG